MSTASLACLQHPLQCFYGCHLHNALQSTEHLQTLEQQYNISAAERSTVGKWLVLFTSVSTSQRFRPDIFSLMPFFFLEPSAAPSMLSQVHVVEVAIAKRRNVMMAAFTKNPDFATIEAAMDRVCS